MSAHSKYAQKRKDADHYGLYDNGVQKTADRIAGVTSWQGHTIGD